MNEPNTDTINTGGFGLNDEIPPEPLAQSEEAKIDQAIRNTWPEQLPCPKCDRTFKNAFALRMHNVRTHGKGWDTGGNFKKKKKGSGGQKWKPGQLERFRASMARIKARKSRLAASAASPAPQKAAINPGVQFCPRCGCNIKNVAAAIAFGDRA